MEIADIKDRDSLKEWLEDRSREECVQIAARAALRVLPLFWEWCLTESAQKHRITALPVLRCLLISRVAGKFSDRTIPGTEVAVGAVADVSSKYEDFAHLAAAAAYSAARIASFIKDFERMTAEVAATAARAADNDPAMFDAIRSDCMALAQAEEKLEGLPLWHGVENPFQSQWLAVKESVSDQQDTWSFWTQWYDSILAGDKPNWPLEQKIALIDNEFWESGPKAVAATIEVISNDPDAVEWKKWTHRSEAARLAELRLGLENAERSLGRVEAAISVRAETIADLEGTATSLNKQFDDLRETTQERLGELYNTFENRFEAAFNTYMEQQAVKAPVELWRLKQVEHQLRAKATFRWFVVGLIGVAFLSIIVISFVFIAPEAIITGLAPIGCDPVERPELCSGFSFRGLLITASVLTILTLLLWFTRLRMKEYLSERHLSTDARERQAFAQAYLGLVAEGDISEEARDQRSLVYSALFRPTTDGIVKEDGGIDPSIAAAISKLLSGK